MVRCDSKVLLHIRELRLPQVRPASPTDTLHTRSPNCRRDFWEIRQMACREARESGSCGERSRSVRPIGFPRPLTSSLDPLTALRLSLSEEKIKIRSSSYEHLYNAVLASRSNLQEQIYLECVVFHCTFCVLLYLNNIVVLFKKIAFSHIRFVCLLVIWEI